MNERTFSVKQIGTVRRSSDGIQLKIEGAYRAALKQLDHFSHVIVVWWAEGMDNPEARRLMQTEPPYAPDHMSGVFATRAPYRPNPVALTTCRILSVDEATGTVMVADIDAFDETPILDLKAYFPVCDRVKNADIPAWLEGWPEWMPEEGLGLEEHEQ